MEEKSERELFAEKYNLKKPVSKEDRDADFYWHNPSSKWIIKHDACERIHAIEKMSNPVVNVITDDNETGTFMLIKIKHKEGTAAASSKSSDADIYAVVAKVSKLKGLKINVIGNSLIISKEINIIINNKEFLKKGICIFVKVFLFE